MVRVRQLQRRQRRQRRGHAQGEGAQLRTHDEAAATSLIADRRHRRRSCRWRPWGTCAASRRRGALCRAGVLAAVELERLEAPGGRTCSPPGRGTDRHDNRRCSRRQGPPRGRACALAPRSKPRGINLGWLTARAARSRAGGVRARAARARAGDDHDRDNGENDNGDTDDYRRDDDDDDGLDGAATAPAANTTTMVLLMMTTVTTMTKMNSITSMTVTVTAAKRRRLCC